MEESRGGGEVRKIHIVYFLSDNGKTDQPHLIRVNRLNRHGVRLRDVKRWLSQTRGRDMPESFAWSYKRSYRGGYVWQDLIDDDLITAISDNEYVLKGSLLASRTKTMDDPFLDGEKPPIKKQAEKREQLMMDENKLSSEETHSKDEFFRIGSVWLKETNSEEEEDSSVTVANNKLKKKKKKIGSDLIKRNFIGCMTVETKGSAHRVAQTEDSSVSGSSRGSNSSKSSR